MSETLVYIIIFALFMFFMHRGHGGMGGCGGHGHQGKGTNPDGAEKEKKHTESGHAHL
jgi:hypothetical protein